MPEERDVLLNELEDRISYHFHDISLLQEALAHRSIKVERGMSAAPTPDWRCWEIPYWGS